MAHHEMYKGCKVVVQDMFNEYAYIIIPSEGKRFKYLAKDFTIVESKGGDDLTPILYDSMTKAKETIDEAFRVKPELFI